MRQARAERAASPTEHGTAAADRTAQEWQPPGTRRPRQPGPSPLVETLQRSPRQQAQRASLAALFGTGIAMPVQRKLHKFEDGKWWEIEPGTQGEHPLPVAAEEGEYFNDVTGKRGVDIEQVRGGLLDRMMQSGGLEEDLGYRDGELVGSWEALSQSLSKHFGGKLAQVDDQRKDDRWAKVGALYLFKSKGKLKQLGDIPKDVEKDLFWLTASFVVQLMTANGQLGYLDRKGWLEGQNHLRVDINYYYNRPMGAYSNLGLHKDTGGDNVFVNLVFDNQETTPGTEWTQDREDIDGPKREVMEEHYKVPEDMVLDIDQAKKDLGNPEVKAPGSEMIMGGVLPKYGYVSWVDELIWHATPNLAQRAFFKVGDRYCEGLRLLLQGKPWSGQDDDTVHLLDVLAALAENPKSVLAPKNIDGIRLAMTLAALSKWLDDKLEEGDRQTLGQELNAMMQGGNVKFSGRIANELDSDGEGQEKRLVRPTKIGKRPRSNSDLKTLDEVKKAAQKQNLRSFIRTWVRVMNGPLTSGD